MNADQTACASSGKATAWDQIDWPKCERHVRRLQARIVKATQEKRWGKVKALQRLLTCSFSGKALAVKRVTENRGNRTSGVDRVLWNSPASKHRAIDSLERRGYQPLPLRRIYIRVLGEDAAGDPRCEGVQPERLDTPAQSGDSRVGQLPSAHRSDAGVQKDAMGSVAMGQTKASREERPMDQPALLASVGGEKGVRGRHGKTNGG